MATRRLLILIFIIGVSNVYAQNHHKRFESIDVLHYNFDLYLNDETDQIEGSAGIQIKFLKPASNCILDLVSQTEENGMQVNSVDFEGKNLSYTHENSLLEIDFQQTIKTGDTVEVNITYTGIPADGLIISENNYGNRTFFGDNWPDRARHWLPTVDHPSDKASVTFSVVAPAHYHVVANGALDTVITVNTHFNKTIWKEKIPISTKLMVIGAADFVVGNDTNCNDIPVNAWVFRENKEQGLENYKYGTKALRYFSDLIGPYPYEKLAHVQSKTRYGGMENASCIFYSENSAISDHSQENLMAHEVAHQWFGNSVTEQNWHHLWLSEGFATYLTHIYKQHYYGEEKFKDGLNSDRERVIRYAKRNLAPIIDTTVNEYIRLLNTNSYQKASWVLHMLRHKLGDENFFKGLQKYYADYKNSTALTDDFKNVMEEVSGKNLAVFFTQWLKQAGHPVLKWNWEQTSDSELQLNIVQTQEDSEFIFPMQIAAIYENGMQENFELNINQKKVSVKLPVKHKIESIKLDQNINLLFEEEN